MAPPSEMEGSEQSRLLGIPITPKDSAARLRRNCASGAPDHCRGAGCPVSVAPAAPARPTAGPADLLWSKKQCATRASTPYDMHLNASTKMGNARSRTAPG